MLNNVWAFLVLSGVLVAGLLGRWGGDGGVVDLMLKSAKSAVLDIALPLAGMMMFWLGLLRVMEKAGVLQVLTRLLSPLMKRLFPEVPAGHPAQNAMVMNLGATMLGLGNSATPLGLTAMGHLQELNPRKTVPTNAMCVFLALNTAGFSLIPTSSIAYLSAAGVSEPYRVIVPTVLATLCATLAGVIAALSYQRLPFFRAVDDGKAVTPLEEAQPATDQPMSARGKLGLGVLVALFAGVAAIELGPDTWRKDLLEGSGLQSVMDAATATAANTAKAAAAKPADAAVVTPGGWRLWMNQASSMAIPAILILAVGAGLARGVKVYEEFVEGAKEGFGVATRIMPFLVAMLAALALFRGSGMLMLIGHMLSPVLAILGFPVELLPLALMRPLSGSGSLGILNDILNMPGATEQLKFTAAILFGSTETTFYVIAVYFGSVGIQKVRHALAAGLTADIVGMSTAVIFGKLLFSAP
jgi:spore maturation protein SpmA